MNAIERASRRAGAITDSLDGLCEPPEAIDLAPISEAIAALDMAEKKLVVCRQLVNDRSRQLAEVESQIKSWAKAHPDCPICGGPISAETLLEGVHAHAGAE